MSKSIPHVFSNRNISFHIIPFTMLIHTGAWYRIPMVLSMSVIGIAAEYNPFHNGHFYHISESKRAVPGAKVIAVMSGSFTQRGDPAICDKYTRTRMALENGVDIVAELPAFYAVSSAEYFAGAAVRLMNAAGVVTHISFGTESGGLDEIRLAAGALHTRGEAVNQMTRKFMSEGLPYFTAREKSLSGILRISMDFIRQPNNILAVEYMKTLSETQSAIIPMTVRRSGAGYHETASALRRCVMANDYPALAEYMPESAFFLLLRHISQYGSADISRLGSILFYLLRAKPADEIRAILDMNDGVAERMLRMCGQHDTITGLLDAVKTKRYAYARLKRAAAHLLLDMRKDTFDTLNRSGGPRYIRILGFRKDAARLLGEMTERASLPVITDLKKAGGVLDEQGAVMLNMDIKAADVYYLACGNIKNTHGINHEYHRGIIVV